MLKILVLHCLQPRDILFEYHRAVFLFVKQLDHLEVCLPYCRLLTGIAILAVFQNLRWNSNKTSLHYSQIDDNNKYMLSKFI